MTALQLYEAVLIELRKENAPNILLELFNYFANKAINQYINKRYNIYDINQQTTDDLRVLKATSILTPTRINKYDALSTHNGKMATYEVILPSDYLHILNCICIYELQKTYKCYNKGDTWRAAATRLTADAYSLVLDNFWNRPTYKRPYYYIHNVNTSTTVPTNPYGSDIIDDTDKYETKYEENLLVITYSNGSTVTINYSINSEGKREKEISRTVTPATNNGNNSGTDFNSIEIGYGLDGNNNQIVQGSDNPKTINLLESPYSAVERGLNIRYGNVSLVRLEIRYGTDDSVFELKNVYIDYLKTPQNIRLTLQQLDRTEDTSQMLEYPDYVCQEIVNELVHIIMENISDLRLLTHPVVSLSIANPAQQLTEPVAQLQPT